MKKQNPCHMCDNAKINPNLEDWNDLSYHGVGTCEKGFRFLISSGNRKPTTILMEKLNEKGWHTIGYYEPKYCPNCGREITEYKRKEEG